MNPEHQDDPVPVRIVNYTNPYDGTPAGDTRLTFDAWVYLVMIVLTVVANIVY